MSDLLQDMGDDDGGGDGDPVDTLLPEDAELLKEVANRLDHDDILFRNPKWLENFRETKQTTIDPLYKDGGKCPKHWTELRFNLQLLMLKARHGWTDTSFNNLLRILGDTYQEGNKVPANTYRAKKLIQPVAMKLKKFHACSNHCILCQGKYENLQSCSHCGVSRYKKNAGCPRMKRRDPPEGQRRRRWLRSSRLLRTMKKRVTHRGKVLPCRCGTCSSSIGFVHYLGTQRMPSSCLGMHQLNVIRRMVASYDIPLMASSGSVSTPSSRSLGTRPGVSGSR
jgi:hypothetical protein